MIELVNPASTDSVFYYNSEKINEFEYTVEQDGSIITLSWDPTYLEVGEAVNALLDDDSEDFNGFQIAEADATAGSLSFELDSSTPDCQYYLYAELLEGIHIQQVYSDDILYNSNSALAPPQNFRAEFISDTIGFAFSWDASIANDIVGYNIIVSDNTGNDSVYATLHPAETSITLFIEDYENKSVLIESFDEEWRIGCPSVLSTLSQNCSVVSTILLETICEGETYAVGILFIQRQVCILIF